MKAYELTGTEATSIGSQPASSVFVRGFFSLQMLKQAIFDLLAVMLIIVFLGFILLS